MATDGTASRLEEAAFNLVAEHYTVGAKGGSDSKENPRVPFSPTQGTISSFLPSFLHSFHNSPSFRIYALNGTVSGLIACLLSYS